ncbi:MAG: methyltransferase family protein [Phycisphaerae bacterium]
MSGPWYHHPSQGIGPAWGTVSAAGLAVLLGLSHQLGPCTRIDVLAGPLGWAIGGGLILAGLGFWIWARVCLSKGTDGRLVRSGPFAIVRHPHYAAGLWLLGPGAAILLADWITLALPIWMGIWLLILLPAEERELARQFGEEWACYRQRTGRLLPRL